MQILPITKDAPIDQPVRAVDNHKPGFAAAHIKGK
jgi:hypothetical protein